MVYDHVSPRQNQDTTSRDAAQSAANPCRHSPHWAPGNPTGALRRTGQAADARRAYEECVRADRGRSTLTALALNELAATYVEDKDELSALRCLALSLLADRGNPATLQLAGALLKANGLEAEAGKLKALYPEASGVMTRLPPLHAGTPDAKTLSTEFARRAFAASDYPERMREALIEMQRQVGDLVIERGRAVRGLLVRHLVMPGMLDDTKQVLDFLAREVSPDAFVNVMGQYRPCHRALEVPGLGHRPTRDEITEAQGHARKLGLRLAR